MKIFPNTCCLLSISSEDVAIIQPELNMSLIPGPCYHRKWIHSHLCLALLSLLDVFSFRRSLLCVSLWVWSKVNESLPAAVMQVNVFILIKVDFFVWLVVSEARWLFCSLKKWKETLNSNNFVTQRKVKLRCPAHLKPWWCIKQHKSNNLTLFTLNLALAQKHCYITLILRDLSFTLWELLIQKTDALFAFDAHAVKPD